MLKSHNVAKLKNLSGKNKVIFDINFDKENEEIVKISIGDEVATVDRKELFGIGILLANSADEYEQVSKSGTKTVEMVEHIRAVTVKANKDIKAGEEVVFNIKFEVPKRIIEYLGGSKEVVE